MEVLDWPAEFVDLSVRQAGYAGRVERREMEEARQTAKEKEMLKKRDALARKKWALLRAKHGAD